ncbi:hypothetical protein OO015_12215 [Thermomicrobium sp. 4228-Ro]|nr:hypothetical protein [Thermomicrobium sp. 4228-Ro]MCX2728255.1 hypothetical protein [Thermomicrobium sp. 4228-Ro]
MRTGDDFDRAVLLAVALLLGFLILACAGIAVLLWLTFRPSAS